MRQKGRLNLLDREAYHFLFKKKKLKSFTQNLIILHARIMKGMRWMAHKYKAIGERKSDFNPDLRW